jgi:hypothetical protein
MKLKERLVLGISVTAVLFTLLLVVDLQMDLGMSGHHLVPSHGRVKFGDGAVDGPGSAYNSFRKRFLQRSSNGSREISAAAGATTGNSVPVSQQQDGGRNGSVVGADGRRVATVTVVSPRRKPAERDPHDDFSDLLDYVLSNAADVDAGAKSSAAVPGGGKYPTLGELTDTPAR